MDGSATCLAAAPVAALWPRGFGVTRAEPYWSASAGRPRDGGRAPTPGQGDGPAALSAASRQIVAIATRGDREAFAALFAHFAPRVKSYLLRLGAKSGAADDIAQETLLTVWRKAASFDPAKAEAATWIFTIARNLRITELRRESRPAPDFTDPTIGPGETANAEESLALAERERRVREALAALPEEQASVVRLSFFEDKPHQQIERDLGIPLGTVKSRLRLALSRIRRTLGEE